MDQSHMFLSKVKFDKVETLKNRCLSTLVELIKSNKISVNELKPLPKNLIKILLNTFSKRGWLTSENISVFLNDQTKTLELSECGQITDETLNKLVNCKYLMKIDLNSNSLPRTQITSNGVSNIFKSCKYLQVVFLRRCVQVDDATIETLVMNCSKLTYLNLGNCPLITDKSLILLGKNCLNLKSINLTATKITDNGIFSLMSINVAKTIEEVHIAHCELITDESIECILLNSSSIKYLLFHSCPKITDASRLALEDYMTNNSNQKVKHLTWTIY